MMDPDDAWVERKVTVLKETGSVTDGRCTVLLSESDRNIVAVIDHRDIDPDGKERMVAYSESKADFENSIREFIWDYLVD